MDGNDLTLLVMGLSLILLAAVSAYFIMLEVASFVRELGGTRGRRPARRKGRSDGKPRPGDTGPLKRGRHDGPAMSAPRPDPKAIQPMRDEQVVRQLIQHLKDEAGDGD